MLQPCIYGVVQEIKVDIVFLSFLGKERRSLF